MPLAHNPSRAPLLILTGPSGAGKSTLLDLLRARKPFRFRRFITCTTRARRPGERHGRDYWFLTHDAFKRGIAQRAFYEWARVYDHYYGSSKQEMERLTKGKLPILLVLDVQGAKTLKRHYPHTFILFLNTSRISLLRRLQKRGATEQDLRKRQRQINREERTKGIADYVLPNKDGELEQMYRAALTVLRNYLRQNGYKT